MPQAPSLDFSTVLATIVHDMKNSLSMMMQSTETLSLRAKQETRDDHNELSRLHYELCRLNGSLTQVLALYRAEKSQLPLTIEEVFIAELFEDVSLKVDGFAEQEQKQLKLDLPPSLSWSLDTTLVEYVLADILLNSLRYSRSLVKVSAQEVDNHLVIKIEDDGKGFPERVLGLVQHNLPAGINIEQSRTGLGLFFASLIAHAHQHNGLHGHVEINNNSSLGGGCFTLTLP